MTEDKNNKPESKSELPKNERQFNQEQYDRLIACSKKGPEGIKEWNKWRKENPDEEICLQGAQLHAAQMQGADLANANLQGAILVYANLQGAKLRGANLQGAQLHAANLQGADLKRANLQGANLWSANLQKAELRAAEMQGATFWAANLQGAKLDIANLEGAQLFASNLQAAQFTGTIMNGSTNFLYCQIDTNTDFRHTGMENAIIESGTKILLKYNIRRMNWRAWYTKHPLLKWLVRPFWKMSDYGRSTGRLIVTFFALALLFAGVYYVLSIVAPPGVVTSLAEGKEGLVPGWLIPFRSIYFSIVTMTTLGFGDMYANCRSFLGHLLLTIQVILGYMLLGAMVTRLAVLFTSDGPAGSFTPMGKKTEDLLAKLEEDKKNAK